MKKLIQLESGEINIQTLLSSRTYYNHDGFNFCVYCHSPVEPFNWFPHRDEDNVEHWVTPTICECELAIQEIRLKKELLKGLTQLDAHIDEALVNKITLDEKTKQLREQFEDID